MNSSGGEEEGGGCDDDLLYYTLPLTKKPCVIEIVGDDDDELTVDDQEYLRLINDIEEGGAVGYVQQVMSEYVDKDTIKGECRRLLPQSFYKSSLPTSVPCIDMSDPATRPQSTTITNTTPPSFSPPSPSLWSRSEFPFHLEYKVSPTASFSFGERDFPTIKHQEIQHFQNSNLTSFLSTLRNDRIKMLESLPAANQPDHVGTRLENYQLQGLQWLIDKETRPSTLTKSSILADDMGLGKTIQILSLIASTDVKLNLVIVPKSLLYQWDAQIKRHILPSAKIGIVIHYEKNVKQSRRGRSFDEIRDVVGCGYDRLIVITTFHCLISEMNETGSEKKKNNNNNNNKKNKKNSTKNNDDTKKKKKKTVDDSQKESSSMSLYLNTLEQPRKPTLLSTMWGRVIVDEAHYMKNPHSQSHKAVSMLLWNRLHLLTATPALNDLCDLQSLLRIMKHPIYSHMYRWKIDISNPVYDNLIEGHQKLFLLNSEIMLRRFKTDILNGVQILSTIPSVNRRCIRVSLEYNSREEIFYTAVERDIQVIFNSMVRRGGQQLVMKNYASILSLIHKLKQAACHPFLVAMSELAPMKKKLNESPAATIGRSIGDIVIGNDGVARRCSNKKRDANGKVKMEENSPILKAFGLQEGSGSDDEEEEDDYLILFGKEKDGNNHKSQTDEFKSYQKFVNCTIDTFKLESSQSKYNGYADTMERAAPQSCSASSFDNNTSNNPFLQFSKSIIKSVEKRSSSSSSTVSNRAESSSSSSLNPAPVTLLQNNPAVSNIIVIRDDDEVDYESQLSMNDNNFISSSKTDILLQHLKEVFDNPLSSKDKIVIFSQFTKFLIVLKYFIEKRFHPKNKSVLFHGGMTFAERTQVLKVFQTNPDLQILLVTLKSGGVGLDLSIANHIFIMDPWWNESVEYQAQDRVNRIGQHKPVFIYQIILEGSIEERIEAIKAAKSSVIDIAFGDEDHSGGGFSKNRGGGGTRKGFKEIQALFKPFIRVERNCFV